jgi:hypothetical protein
MKESMSPLQNPPCCRHNIVKGKDQLIIETASGQRITLNELSASILIEDANGNTINLGPSGITIQASAKISLACAEIDISAGMMTVNAGMARFTGVVQADTVIANSVIYPHS